jgi:hypothetical protein
MIRLVVLMAPLFVAGQALAAPPPDIDLDGPVHAWFERQRSVIGSWCCSVADGHILDPPDWRTSGGHYEVRIDQVWYDVPANSLRDPSGGPNPTGQAVVWWSRVGGEMVIHCFAPGNEL